MKLDIRWLFLLAAAACLNKATFVSITPEHGYADGCIDVILRGHHLGTQAKGAVGGTDFIALDAAENEPDVDPQIGDEGYVYYGVVPPGAQGWADVELIVDGEKLTLPDGFYYENCPASVNVDGISIPDPAAPGDTISIVGCGLSDQVTLEVYPYTGTTGTTTGTATGAATGTATGTPTGTGTGTGGPAPIASLPLVSDCSTAQVHVDIPALPDGTYVLAVVHADGTSYTGDCYYDSGDTGLTCIDLILNVGGAR